MGQVLGTSAGHALEVQEAIDYLTGRHREPRLHAVTLALTAHLLCLGGLAPDLDAAQALAHRALDCGAAAERFARMVAALGGPADVLADPGMDVAPVQCDVPAPTDGVLAAADVRAIGLAVGGLGGGRSRPGDRIDPRVGFSHVLPLGAVVRAGQPLARVHAAHAEAARQAAQAVAAAFTLGPVGASPSLWPVIRQVVSFP
jgi:thymidine phosphorylase